MAVSGKNVVKNTLVFYPFAYALSDDELTGFCWYCLHERCSDNALKTCGKCHRAQFCGRQCQEFGWSDHRAECAGLARLDHVPDIEVRLLGRIVSRTKQIQDGKDANDPHFFKDRQSTRSIMDIWSHTEDMRRDLHAYKKFLNIYHRLVTFYGEKHLLPQETVFELHCRNYINRHGISDKAYLREIGKGLYLDLCAYDHSCAPNVIYTHDGFVATLRPLVDGLDLSDRSKVFYSYIDLLNCKQQRRKLLRDSWYFHCECAKCTNEDEQLLTSIRCSHCGEAICIFGPLAKHPPECPKCEFVFKETLTQDGIAAMRAIQLSLDNDEFEPENTTSGKGNLRTVEQLLDKYGTLLSACNVYWIRLVQAAIKLTDAADTQRMLAHHLKAEKCMRLCYPMNHPALAYHLSNIGLFYSRLNQKEKAKDYLSEAYGMFCFVLGKHHARSAVCSELIESV